MIVYATGYNITFPFFDPDFISAPGNDIRLYKRMFFPGIDKLVFIGFAQAVPTLFPFIECQAKLMAAYAVGPTTPPVAEMERVIDADQKKYVGHCVDRPRHTQQVDYFHYEHDIRTRELPAGIKRAEPPPSSPGGGVTHADVSFDSRGCPAAAGISVVPVTAPAGPVMGHGFGGTKDSGLEPFAERLSGAGLDVLAFDYRGFGSIGR